MSSNLNPGGTNPPAGGGRAEPNSRLVNTQEVSLTVLFLIVLTMILLYGISIRWPACELPEDTAATATANTSNTNGSPNANAGNTNAPGAANNNAAANTNANAQANTNTGGNANGNRNANGNQNANGGTGAGTPPTQGPQPQQTANPNQDVPFIRTVEPGSGDISGNKMVTVKGERLGPDVVVRFDQKPARTGSSSADSMIVWTPHHAEGAVDVSVERGSEKDGTLKKNVLPGGYIYVCPTPRGSSLFMMLIMAGALGGCVHALRSLFWYVGNRELRLSWLPMYYILPFVGAAMAMLFSLLILAGLIDDTSGRNMSLFIIAIAGLVGMFSQQAALKLTDIANATFTKPGPGKDSRQQESQSVGAGTGSGTPGARIEPSSGPTLTKVAITGTGFTDVKSVTFDRVAAGDVAFDKASSSITATAPDHAQGPVDVVVTNAAGQTVTLVYTYTAVGGGGTGGGTGGGSASGAGGGTSGGGGGGGSSSGGLAVAAKIEPPAGPAAGNTAVTITGTGFTDVAQVLFGDTPSATPPEINPEAGTINATAPAHEPGTVTVTVSDNAGEVKTVGYEYK
ncbi:MAG: IPT/TIG domain-containing protein [Pyrinomonadaceae bacterium]